LKDEIVKKYQSKKLVKGKKIAVKRAGIKFNRKKPMKDEIVKKRTIKNDPIKNK
jgi:hypothetical protein